MTTLHPTYSRGNAARPATRAQALLAVAAFASLFGVSLPAQAVDGCTVLLCLAAPSWRAVAQCVPPITQLFRDLARGKAFPTCGMSGAGNSASHAWADAPAFCPRQYTRVIETESRPVYSCDYAGAASVSINGGAFTRTWWSMGGDSVTEFSPAAKAQLGSWNPRFDDEYAAWAAIQPPVRPTLPGN